MELQGWPENQAEDSEAASLKAKDQQESCFNDCHTSFETVRCRGFLDWGFLSQSCHLRAWHGMA